MAEAKPARGAAGLADALRGHVRVLHAQAETSGAVRDILRGRVRISAYGTLLRSLLPCYEAMEAALERHRGTALLAAFAQPALYRAAAIRHDLVAIADSCKSDLSLLREGDEYAAHVDACASGDGSGLIGHAYARYMGDLSGGPILRRRLAAVLPDDAMRFYAFSGVADMAACKRDYRAAIDDAGRALGDWGVVLDAAAAAFRFNIAISLQAQKAGGNVPFPPDPPSRL